MRISLGDVSLWFDVSGPSVIPQEDTTVERPVLVAVHGGPGLDHMTVKPALEPLAADFQVLYFDLRGHGRSDRSSAESWTMRTWADDLRRLCDALGLRQPVILGSSFGGDVALTYAALFPDHPGGIILANTTGGHWGGPRVIEAFGRVGGPEAAAIVERIYAGTVINDIMTGNQAIGDGANPAQAGTPGGGSGGAIYNDGDTYTLTIDGSVISGNSAREGGGAVFYVSNDRTGTMQIENSRLTSNPNAGFQTSGFPGIFFLGRGQPSLIATTDS